MLEVRGETFLLVLSAWTESEHSLNSHFYYPTSNNMKHRFKELKVWQKAMEVARLTYVSCVNLPSDERFGLISQMRRAAVSIPSNVAEGAGRDSAKEFQYFLSISNGSSYELETQLLLAESFGYLSAAVTEDLCARLNELQRMIHGLKKSLNDQSIQ
jgi:four helix bundle protein